MTFTLDNPSPETDTDPVPASFEEMYALYYLYIVRWIQKLGIDQQNAEDVAQAILIKFYEHDAIKDFDPEYTTSHDGVVRKAVFKTFLSGFVRAYVRHYIDRQNKLHWREGLSTDIPVVHATQTGPMNPVTWIEVFGPPYEETYDDLHEEDFVNTVTRKLETLKPIRTMDQCDLPEFFQRVLRQIDEDGRVNARVLAEEYRVSKTTIQNWLKRLRTQIGAVLAEEDQ